MRRSVPRVASPGDDRVQPATRWLAAFIVPFLVAAFAILYLRPHDTERLFAWGISPPLTAMMLGAVYLGGAYYFVRVLFSPTWHAVQMGLLPVTAFASLLGVATIIHWDRFTPGHVSFIAWAGLYFTAPVLVLVAYLRNHIADPRTPRPGDPPVSSRARTAFGIAGTVTLLLALTLFAQPSLGVEWWPWMLTPLTARVVGAILALGGVGILIAGERRWSAIRLMVETLIVMQALVLLAAVLRQSDFRSPALGVGFTAGLAAGLAWTSIYYFRWRR